MIRTLEDGWFSAGRYKVAWDGMDDRGRAVGSGFYLVRLEAANGTTRTWKALLLR